MFEPAPKATIKVERAEVATTAPPPAVDEQPTIALPDQAPLPEPAPEGPRPERSVENTTPDSKAKSARTEAKRVDRRKAEEIPAKSKARYDEQPTRQPSPSGVGNAPGRGSVASHGGASAGEKAAYAARLNSHVRRFERYPPEAERQGITGSARILITIDRSGRLVSSRLAGSAGSEILDAAARDTASRASPYPPPPDGIGGSTLTFAATIRFRR
jgi:protein TonB